MFPCSSVFQFLGSLISSGDIIIIIIYIIIIYSCLYREPQTHQWPSLESLWLKELVRRKGKNSQSKILIKSLITKYQKLKKPTLCDRGPQHSKKKRINKKFPASNPPAHTFPPFTHNLCYTHTPKTCTTMIQCKPRSPKATQIYLRSSNSRDKGGQNKNNTTLKKPVC